MKPQIINSAGLLLPQFVNSILEIMFQNTEQVAIKSEFDRGLGVSRVFLVSISAKGSESLAVVKMAPIGRIQREWNAHNSCMFKTLRGITKIQGQPIYLPGSIWGGLHYPFIGNNKYKVESMYDYCQHATTEDIVEDILEDELFENLRLIWHPNEIKTEFYLSSSYDHLLPHFLLAEEAKPPLEAKIYELTPETISKSTYVPNSYVKVTGFQITSLKLEDNEVTLSLPNVRNSPYRIRWRTKDVSLYEIDEIIKLPLIGVIRKTRTDLLFDYAQSALGSDSKLTTNEVILPSGIVLPNPITHVPKLLNQPLKARIACIHGDLNLENILVEHYEDNHMPHLIDFDNTRQDHILHDPFRFEMSVATSLVPEILAKSYTPDETIYQLYKSLHDLVVNEVPSTAPKGLEKPFAMIVSIRTFVRNYLVVPNNWLEYYQGLVIYLLGALKFRNLERVPTAPLPKRVAFLAAATSQALINDLLNTLKA